MSDSDATPKVSPEEELRIVVEITKQESDTISWNRYFSADCGCVPDEHGNLCILDKDDEVIAIFAKNEWRFVERKMVRVNAPRYFRT